MKFESKAIRIQTAKSSHREHSNPVYLTSSFCYDNAEQMRAAFAGEEEAFIYSRFVNPNSQELEHKLAALENTEACFVTASGMAAVFASFMAFLHAGDHILSSRAIFGSTNSLLTKWLNRWGISHDLVEGTEIDTWEKLIKPETKLLYIETPSNPGLELIDLEAASKFCKRHQIMFVVDNCFATPYLQQPQKFGADLIIHSATKYIDGQGRVLGGAVCGSKQNIEEVKAFCRATGPSLSPFNAWLLSKSLETLAIRMDRHSDNALQLAKSLEGHNKLNWVRYPFLESHPQYALAQQQMKSGGGIVCFELAGGAAAGVKFLDNLRLCSLTANLGDSRSIASHPYSTTHAKLSDEEKSNSNITEGLIRISVGLEHIDDIQNDIFNALNTI